jgi:hypothetical protein
MSQQVTEDLGAVAPDPMFCIVPVKVDLRPVAAHITGILVQAMALGLATVRMLYYRLSGGFSCGSGRLTVP